MTFEPYPPASAGGGDHAFFDTVAQMQSAVLANGDQCHTAGYSAVGDGGGVDGYTYHSTGRPAVATGDGRPGFVIDGGGADDWFSANNKRGETWVEQWGAIGDGSDSTVAIQAAVAALQADQGGEIRFGVGEFVTTAPIIIEKGRPIHLSGLVRASPRGTSAANLYGTRITTNHSDYGIIIGSTETAAGQERTYNHRISDIRFTGVSTSKAAIRFGTPGTNPFDNATSECELLRLYISGYDGPAVAQDVYTGASAFAGACGVFIAQCIRSKLENVIIEKCQHAVGESSPDFTTTLLFFRCAFRENLGYAIRMFTGKTITFFHCLTESNNGGSVQMITPSGHGGSVRDIIFDGHHSENNLAGAGTDLFDFDFGNENGGFVRNIQINGGSMGVGEVQQGCLKIDNGRNCRVIGTTFINQDASFPYIRTTNTDNEGITIEAEVPAVLGTRLDIDANTNFIQTFQGRRRSFMEAWVDPAFLLAAKVPAILWASGIIQSSAAGGGDDVMETTTLPANIITTDRNGGYTLEYWGRLANNVNSKGVFIQIAGADVFRFVTTNADEVFRFTCDITYFSDFTTFLMNTAGIIGTSSYSNYSQAASSSATLALQVDFGGFGVAAGDVTLSGTRVTFNDAP